MATYLVCSTPVHGHVAPVLGAAGHLVERGHRVIVLTGSRFADRVAAIGAEFRPLAGIADFDDRDVTSYLPERERYRGIAQAQYDIQTIFVTPIPEQYRAVRAIVAAEQPDAILVDGAFGGVAPLLLRDAPRPPVLALGVTPLTQSSRDVAPAGTALPPSSTPLGRIRNRLLDVVAKRILFRRTQALAQRILSDLGIPRTEHFIMDISSAFDRFLQLCPREFEYPRSDIAPNTAFVGPIPPGGSADIPLPAWWGELDGLRPVVHVTQGTIDNHDLDRLIRPTLRALEGLDVLVVVSLGGRSPDELGAPGELPTNARVASYLPYDRLLPLSSVYVTNGGYGGVQHALREGVPIVVAGDTEDKPEVAARIGWSGTGIDLRTGSPEPEAVRAAVMRVLAEPAYRIAAQRMATAIAGTDALALIEHELEASTAARAR
ncbi:nucleotide disphospho-sugar-binding domain-containing protein [Compostimonas suwonensis]|uniref:MGT family glycosyltransferase n=1 Tax=Compostimonas suwonensis TaxID=1048394 RepID=A0A2M9BU31_9MICO|nr:nucleotide disphospho-sugar-binding domain-containing protein [Compostimonas suwonensis]PJJ61431.1 MGT family glycosyltransferase [Compostimonas suwonensis]